MVGQWNDMLCVSMLAICSLQDLRERKIKVICPLLWGMAGIFLNIGKGGVSLAADCVPGLFLLAVSWITRGAVGWGDGLVLLAAGLLAGWETALHMMFWAMAGAAILACVMMAAGRWGRKQKIAFVPFLLGSFIGVILWKR